MIKNVACLLDTVVHPFELGVASEVFGLDRSAEGLPNFDFAICAASPAPVPSVGGLHITPGYGLERVSDADLVVIPAWRTDAGAPEPAVAAALHCAVGRGATILSVCSGAFLLAEVGLLEGRRATCHWFHEQQFRDAFPTVTLEPDRLYVEDGPIITSAGTAAGIDACLHLVRREFGAAVAGSFARRMVVPPYRDGGQSQYVDTPVPAAHDGSANMAELLEWMGGHLSQQLDVKSLAARAHMSTRTFARRFASVTGATPYEWLTRQRVFLAQRLLEDDVLAVEEIARRSGFGNGETLRHHFTRQLGTTPTSYRRHFCTPVA